MAGYQNNPMIYSYRFVKYALILGTTFIYTTCFKWSNIVFKITMAFLFAYSFSSVANMAAHFFIYFTNKPKILPEASGVVEGGIPKGVNIVFFRPVFVKSNPEMDTHLDNLRQDALNSLEQQSNVRFMIIDNTRDAVVREYARQRIKRLQDEFGKDRVFYLHRSQKCDFFKKVGIYQDAIMLLHDGWTRPRHYISQRWQPYTKGMRDPNEAVFDEVIGDISVLGIKATADDIIKGKDITIDEGKRINIAIVQDADNVWPKGAIRKLVAKMLHPANKRYTIYQPSIEISNPDDNGYVKMASIARQMYGFDPIAKWRIFNFSPFYGKGAMEVNGYIRDIVESEALHPEKAASHDFQEALHTWSVLLEDVYIWEKTFSNKLAELTRTALWGWGDLETVRQFLLKPFEAGRKAHLFVLLRNVIGTLMYDLWVLGSAFGFMMPALSTIAKPASLVRLFACIALVNILLPKFIVPIVSKFYKRPYDVPTPLLSQQNVIIIVGTAIFELFAAILVHYLDLVYKPIGFVKNFTKQLLGRSYVWKTGAMSEIETHGVTIFKTYKILRLSTAIGAILLILSAMGFLPGHVVLFLSPYIASFILGPFVIWLTAK